MKVGLFAFAVLTAIVVQDLCAETLGDVLVAHGVPSRILPAPDLKIPVVRASASWSIKGSTFLIAYYRTETEILPNVFHVVRYEGSTQNLNRTDLRGMDVPFHGFDTVMDNPSSICMGSVLSVSEEDGLVTIETHVGPSAGCILILNHDLTFRVGLYGWVLGRIKHELIFERSMVHSASVSEGRLAIFDIDKKQAQSIYPAPDDHERSVFSAQLARHMPSAEWCEQHNDPCDPKSFSADIEHVIVDPKKLEFGFDVQMTSVGFGPEAERLVKPQTVHYPCKKIGGEWLLSAKPQPRLSTP